MAIRYRIPDACNWPCECVNTIVNDDALCGLRKLPDECVALIVTSPPYWNTIDYGGIEGQIGQSSYEQYLNDMLAVWQEAHRVLIPNGKMAIITPILPIPKSQMNEQHTRHLKNINSDIEFSILSHVKGLERYSLFIWQKQTTTKMFGSYPYPPNLYEDNTIEFINVFVKDGAPPSIPAEAKEPSKITQEEWLNLTMQVWPMYPEDVKRAAHPAPFPLVLPLRLITMYTFRSAPEADFAGDIVLDMFSGTGSTCLAAKAAGRNWIGIDLNPEYCTIARNRVAQEYVDPGAIMLERNTVKAAVNSKVGKQLELFPESE